MAQKVRRLMALLIAVLTGGVVRVTLHGRTAWLHPRTLRVLPAIAGADDGEGDGGDAGDTDDVGADETQGSAKGHEDARWDDPPDDDAELEEWKSYARKWESRAKATGDARKIKAAEKRAVAAEKRLKEFEDASKSEQEKLLEAARKEAREAALSEAQLERRNDRLEVAVTRLAAKTFADVDDALVHVQRAVAAGDIDADELFDEKGKVHTDALESALDDLLERKPHLAAAAGNGRAHGDGDGGKGAGAAKDLEGMSIEDHMRRQGRIK